MKFCRLLGVTSLLLTFSQQLMHFFETVQIAKPIFNLQKNVTSSEWIKAKEQIFILMKVSVGSE